MVHRGSRDSRDPRDQLEQLVLRVRMDLMVTRDSKAGKEGLDSKETLVSKVL
jgi:hypothetical protein